MFDPHHNAVKDFYLVNGDLTGSWEGLPQDTIILNWNSGKPALSLGRGKVSFVIRSLQNSCVWID